MFRPDSTPNRSVQETPLHRKADRRLATATIVTSALLPVLLLACGGGGGSDGTTGGTAGTASTSTRLEFFQASLDAIDPRNPDTVIVIDAAAAELISGENEVGALPAIRGTSNGMVLNDAVIEYVIYPREDGTLYRVSTDASDGIPTPVRVSSMTDALPLCDTAIGLDFQDVENTRFAYGSDGQDCRRSLTWRVVSLTDDEATPPQDFPGRPLAPLVDNETGAHTGWLALNDGILQRLAPDLSVQADNLFQGVFASKLLGATEKVYFVELNLALYAFDPISNTLIDFGFDFTGPCRCASEFAVDSEFAFLVDQGELFRADPTTSLVESIDAPMDVFPNTPPNISPGLSFLLAGAKRVAWSYFSDADGNLGTLTDQSMVIRSVARDGSEAFELNRLDPGVLGILGLSPFTPVTSGEWIFFNNAVFDSVILNDFRARAVAQRLDGTSTQAWDDSFWIGSSSRPVRGTEVILGADHLTRADDLPDLSNLNAAVSITLTSVNATDPTAPGILLGQLPQRGNFAFAFPGLGPERIGVMLASDGSGGTQTDILYWVDGARNSLRVLTNTTSVNEIPAALF